MNTFGLRKPVFAFWLGLTNLVLAPAAVVVRWCRKSLITLVHAFDSRLDRCP